MDVTNSSTKPSLLARLCKDYPQFTFRSSDMFRWSPIEQTIYYSLSDMRQLKGKWDILHELGHGLLTHTTYNRDVMLIQMEAQAWKRALEVAEKYKITIEDTHIENSMATYRDWLVMRATCPACSHSGIQKNKSTYQCINCRCSWRANDAKFCVLRRYRLDTQN